MKNSGIHVIENRLQDITVWLTRPLHQADAIKSSLLERGVNVLHIPMLEIEPLEYDEKIKTTILNLDHFDIAIFISTNAAKLGLECVDTFRSQYPAHLLNYAVGPATSEVLNVYGLKTSFSQQGMSSEALLAMPQLQDIEGKKVLIFQGTGGREVLAQGLLGKGAVVECVEIYRRKQPAYSGSYLLDCIRSNYPDTIVITSAEALVNLISHFEAIWPDLYSVKLLVSSLRLRDIAIERGFSTVVEMPGANDEAIILSLERLPREPGTNYE